MATSTNTSKTPATVTAKGEVMADLTKIATADLDASIKPEQRRAIANSGRAAEMWQAYALQASGKTTKETAEILGRQQVTIRQHVWTVALALAMADVEHTEQEGGLPPQEVATFLENAVQQVAAIAKVTRSEEPLIAQVESARKVVAASVAMVEAAGESDEAFTEPGAVEAQIQAAMTQRADSRAKALQEAKDKAKQAEQEKANAQAAAAAQDGDETPAQRQARLAQQERTTVLKKAASVSDLDEVIGNLSTVVGTVLARKERGTFRVTADQAYEVAMLALSLERVAGEAAMQAARGALAKAEAQAKAKQAKPAAKPAAAPRKATAAK